MDLLEIVILAAAAWTVFTQARSIAASRGNITISGRMPGRLGIQIMFLCIIISCFLRPRDVLRFPAVFAAALAVTGIYLFIRTGLGADGLFYNGRVIPYREFEYYMFTRERANIITLRLHLRNQRDIILHFLLRKKAIL